MRTLSTYLTTSTPGIQNMSKIFEKVLKVLKKTNCVNLNTYIADRLKPEKIKIYQSTKKDDQLYTKSLKLINKVNFIIADVTYASITVGRQIEYGLQKGIPVLCLLNADSATYISPSLFDTDINLQTFRSYNDKTLETVLFEYIKSYQEKKVRFNLFISRKNENFLNWLTANDEVSKSEIVRRLIEEKMKKNKKYKEII